MKLPLAITAFAVVATQSVAAVVPWTATLDQEQEVPEPIAVPGAGGSASGTIDTDTDLLTWDVLFSGLSGPAVGLHFHSPAAPGETAPVVVSIGDISGLDSPSTGSTTITPEGTAALLDGLYYINAHTELNPAGEIRGQVVPSPSPVPVPASLPLIAGALALLGFVRRRA